MPMPMLQLAASDIVLHLSSTFFEMAFCILQHVAGTFQTSVEIARVNATSLATRKTHAGLGLEAPPPVTRGVGFRA